MPNNKDQAVSERFLSFSVLGFSGREQLEPLIVVFMFLFPLQIPLQVSLKTTCCLIYVTPETGTTNE